MQITLSPLELILLSGFISLVTGLVVRLYLGSRYVLKNECDRQREVFLAYKKDMKIIFRMLRSIIAHMEDLTPEQRAQILNETEGYE